MKSLIQKTRGYLNYVEEHYDNVQKAWKVVQEKCTDMAFISDDFIWYHIDQEVKNHDKSKLSHEEFIPYRQRFFADKGEQIRNGAFDKAWTHHKKHNLHHWESWTGQNPNDHGQAIHCVHMVVDWMAMGYKFGDTAQAYYEKNKDKIHLPDWAEKFIYEIFKRVYK
jgi:hypothetical protein